MNLDGHIPQTKLISISSILAYANHVKCCGCNRKCVLKNFDNIPMMNLMKHDIIIIVPHHTFLPQDGKKYIFMLMVQRRVIGNKKMEFRNKFTIVGASSTLIDE